MLLLLLCYGRTVFFGFFLIAQIACSKYQVTLEEEINYVVTELNNSVDGLIMLITAQQEGKTVTAVSEQKNDDGTITYLVDLEDGQRVRIGNYIESSRITVPSISIGKEDELLYWKLNGVWMNGEGGQRIEVFDVKNKPSFFLKGTELYYTLGEEKGTTYYISTSGKKHYDVIRISYDLDLLCISIAFDSGLELSSTIAEKYSSIKRDVPNEAFYKDVFLDNGVRLATGKTLNALTTLGLPTEVIDFSFSDVIPEEVSMQSAIISGNQSDINGRLLYPDGQPRFKMLFVNGGRASIHGQSLGEQALSQLKAFVDMGGSYVGVCGGAFLASKGSEKYPYFLGLWPGVILSSGIANTNIDMSIVAESPLLLYYDYGGDMLIRDVVHSGGGFPESVVPGGEVLARFDCPNLAGIHQQPSVWAYKKDSRSGRLVACGSHPEGYGSGERLDLMKAMIQYALDGAGATTIKGYLENGRTRVMDKETVDSIPAYTRIGDMQCHHFVVNLPSDAKDISFHLDCPTDTDFRLMLCKDTYAFNSVADYIIDANNGSAELSFPSLSEGLWYVGVQCITTVTTTETEYGQAYIGRTDVLNGVPYTINVSWK